MSDAEWRWADPRGQQRLVRIDELRAALANGAIPPNAPVWKPGWKGWIPANDVPELMSQALAAANGIVPNIPPPPLFVVAAQSEFESHTPDSSRISQRPPTEPPPPPPYVPVATPSSQPNLPSTPSVNRMKGAKKQTMLGTGPAHPPAHAPAISASAATGSSGAEQLKRALPHDLPPASRFGTEPPKQNLPTVVGVPSIEDPRAQPEPKKSDRPGLAPADAAPLKRPTLILYGGAPQDDPGRASSAPPIVATAPGAPAGKNAVTQPPPWDQGAVELGPQIPKNAPPPRLRQESVSDEISESLFIEATDAGPKLLSPPKRSSSIPPPFRPSPHPKGLPKTLAPPIPGGPGGTKRPPPFVPGQVPNQSPADTTPELIQSLDPDQALLDSGDPDATNKYDGGARPSLLVHLDPLVARFPKLAPVRAQLAKFEEGKPRFFLPVVGGLIALVGLLFFAMFLKLVFGGNSDEMAIAKTHPSATASDSASAPVATNAPANTVATASSAKDVTPPPPPAVVTKTPCSVVGSSKMISGKALVPTGIEVVAAGNSILIGFASAPKDGAAIAVNPSTLAVTGQTKTHASDTLKRVEPLAAEGRPQVSPNIDKKGDALAGRRTVPSIPSFDLGVADGNLAWAPRGSEKTASLWALSGSAPVEALRGVPLDGGGGIAVAYRRSGAIWIGIANGDKTLAPGNLSSTQGLGAQVGSPAIAASGNAILAIWADRASTSDAWGLRWQRWKIGDAPNAAEEFAPPSGGLGAPFMSPGVASLGGGRFLVVWTEGPAQGHQVRALTIGADGQVQGDALTISANGENAGQGQAAVTADGRGVVAYLASAGAKNFQVSATSVSCPK